MSKTNWTFVEWIDQNGQSYNPNDTFIISEDMVLTALWKSNNNSHFTITYIGDSGAIGQAPVDLTDYASGALVEVLGRDSLKNKNKKVNSKTA